MEYQEAEHYLDQCALLGSKPGLAAVTELLSRLGDPQKSLRFIHIAGTNGKGSVGSFLQHILKEAGYRTGFFSSPFLENRREMIQLNCRPIDEHAFASVIGQTAECADSMERSGFMHPTEFEIITAAAYAYFKDTGCDFVIVEAGMGGRLDATNVMEHSMVSVLTRIDYDHLAFLGHSLEEITREKCGIFRSGCPVAIYPYQPEESFSVIKNEAIKKGCPLYIPDVKNISIEKSDASGSVFSNDKFTSLKVLLPGNHQVFNAALALSAVSALQEQGISVSETAIRSGLLQCRWPGRFEILSENPPVILDGAHNVNGVHAFCETLQTCYPQTEFVGVIAMLGDKDYQTALTAFARQCSRLILTEVPNPRTARISELLQASKTLNIPVEAIANPEEAVMRAFALKEKNQGLFCAGSLYALPIFKKACHECKPLMVS